MAGFQAAVVSSAMRAVRRLAAVAREAASCVFNASTLGHQLLHFGHDPALFGEWWKWKRDSCERLAGEMRDSCSGVVAAFLEVQGIANGYKQGYDQRTGAEIREHREALGGGAPAPWLA